MWLKRVSGGNLPLMDLQTAKVHLRILDDDSFDVEIDDLVLSVTAQLDVDDAGQGGLAFPLGLQVWGMFQAKFPAGQIDLPFSGIEKITSVKYWDTAGQQQTLAADQYILAGSGGARCLVPLSGVYWPSVADRPDAVEITFEAGHATMELVPNDIKRAAKLLIGHYFENHSEVVVGTVSVKIQAGVDSLLQRYRRYTN